jgi:putative adenylate-forming enzyme
MGLYRTVLTGIEWARCGQRKSFASRKDLEHWQNKKVLTFLRHTLPCSAALRQRFKTLPPEKWRELPVTNKAEMMQSFDSLLTRPLTQAEVRKTALSAEQHRTVSQIGSLAVGMSSGTSGHRGLFVISPAERARWAGAILGRVIPGGPLSRQRIALLLRANSPLFETLQCGQIAFRYVDILKPVANWMGELQSFNPTLIAAPPSILSLLAQAQRDGKCRLNPDRIFGIAEVLDDLQHQQIKSAWDAPLLQIYQATEGFLAASIDEKRMLMNEDLLVIEQEWIDKARNLFVPVITDFSRTTQPIVRYRLDDILEETDPGAWHPYRAISKIHGRANDLLAFTTIRGTEEPVSSDLLVRAIISTDAPLKNYEVVQDRSGKLTFAVLWEPLLSEEQRDEHCHKLEQSIAQWCVRSGFRPPPCRFTTLSEHADPSRKFRRIRRDMKNEN